MPRQHNPPIPCQCGAYPFPHRIGGGICYANLVCEHGVRQSGHPDFDPLEDHCGECQSWEYADLCYDLARDT
jgi:hypothetical protein